MQIDLSIFPVLHTNRLTLRALSIDDLDELFRLRSDERVNQYIGRSSNITPADVEAFIQKINSIVANNDAVYWAISLKDKPELIGTICYWNVQPEKHMADIGYELLPEHQGKGFMQEAIAAVITYGFEVVGFQVIAGLTHPHNQASRKLLERSGFKLDEKYQFVSEENAGGELIYVSSR